MSTPQLTIAIPFRGSQNYLREAVQSVVDQDCPRWRLVICEDEGGLEVTASFLASYDDRRISHHRETKTLDIAGVYNRCLELASSELVTLLHHDDRLRPNYVASMLAAAERHPDAVAFFCRPKLIGSQGLPFLSPRDIAKRLLTPRFHRGEKILQGQDAATSLVRANFIVGPSMCFRRSRLSARRFDPQWRQVLDLALNIRLLMEGETLVGLSEPAYAYRRHAQQATSQNLKRLTFFTEQLLFFDELAKQAQRIGWHKVAKAARARRIVKLDLGCQAIYRIMRLQWRAAAAQVELLVEILRNPKTIDPD